LWCLWKSLRDFHKHHKTTYKRIVHFRDDENNQKGDIESLLIMKVATCNNYLI